MRSSVTVQWGVCIDVSEQCRVFCYALARTVPPCQGHEPFRRYEADPWLQHPQNSGIVVPG